MENDQEFLPLEDFEMFKFVFDNPMMDGDARCSQVEVLVAESKDSSLQDFSLTTKEALKVELENFAELETKWSIMDQEENRLDGFLQELDEFENVKVTATSVEKKKSNPPSTKSNKAVEKQDNGHYNLGSYGSMRKEKDWKRTLACKLFEERNNEDDLGEGMDLLWETYEMESSKSKSKGKANSKSKKKSNNKKKYHEEIEYKGHDDEEEDESDGQLCCLQALKFSAGKMNLGMGKPNLVKISKAIKGIGWLHNLSSRRHSKKVHNGDRF
ncbi:hypothetical protein ACH5RR_010408 [Cinchona calisaya]|uniref:Uncharacterized protein n=1 Tax=Cinchona calisaya TaxID=153742 RepID=A0ABD3AIW5_9GENT